MRRSGDRLLATLWGDTNSACRSQASYSEDPWRAHHVHPVAQVHHRAPARGHHGRRPAAMRMPRRECARPLRGTAMKQHGFCFTVRIPALFFVGWGKPRGLTCLSNTQMGRRRPLDGHIAAFERGCDDEGDLSAESLRTAHEGAISRVSASRGAQDTPLSLASCHSALRDLRSQRYVGRERERGFVRRGAGPLASGACGPWAGPSLREMATQGPG